ncbi:MAG: excinuclease subunit, partial [Actinomycetota bacterium]|nr:excinuclease subunit [Actinomycetota bacterium]
TAISETNRRRALQIAYNTEHGIDPTPLRKKIADITDLIASEAADIEALLGNRRGRGVPVGPLGTGRLAERRGDAPLPVAELEGLIAELTASMHTAAEELNFEVAARYRDEVAELKKELRAMREAGMPDAGAPRTGKGQSNAD